MADPIALVFDLDGTLIHSAPDIHRVANLVLAGEGLPPLSYETVKGFIGSGVRVLVERMLAHLAPPDASTRVDRMTTAFIDLYEDDFDLTTLFHGVPEALQQLAAAGHPMAICTNKPEGPARAVLQHFGLLTHFPVVIGGDTLPLRKPDPAPLHRAMSGLGVTRCLFIGDSEVDAATALAAQTPLILYTQGYRHSAPHLMGATALFDDFIAFPALIQKF